MEWWGHSKEHGWVVLDRTTEGKASGPNQVLSFFRFRDSVSFEDTRKNWVPPLYVYAPNYIGALPPEASAAATVEWDDCKSRWPELQRQILQKRLDAEAQAESERVARELQEKKAAREKKKQVGLTT
jgi:hypothetical protein